MIKIENVTNSSCEWWNHVISGMRNPMNSWDRMDSQFEFNPETKAEDYAIGTNDAELMMKLMRNGPVHRKFMRMLPIIVDITAPLYWWKEFDTYKVGTVANSCSTMHKIHEKEFTLDDFSHEHLMCNGAATRGIEGGTIDDEKSWEFSFDSPGLLQIIIKNLNYYREQYLAHPTVKLYWWQMIQLLPSSYNQKRTVMLNYETLNMIYIHRHKHKLDEWVQFCEWIKSLPMPELMVPLEDMIEIKVTDTPKEVE